MRKHTGVWTLRTAIPLFIVLLFVVQAGLAGIDGGQERGEGADTSPSGPAVPEVGWEMDGDAPPEVFVDNSPEPSPDDAGTRQDGRLWTVLVYMAADNNLERFALEDMNEMELVGSTDQVAMVCQIDRHPSSSGSGFTSADGDWTDTRRYYIDKNEDPDALNSTRVDSGLGELDMSDPDVLDDFIRWGITEYPAEQYLVVMWNHGTGILGGGGGRPLGRSGGAADEEGGDADEKGGGAGEERGDARDDEEAVEEGGDAGDDEGAAEEDGGVRGFNEDWTDGKGETQIWELEEVLAGVVAEVNGGERIDVVGFDECYMGHIETGYQLIDEVEYVVASSDQEPDVGWDYTLPMTDLVEDPHMTPEELAISITGNYVDTFSKLSYMTQAATSLDALESLGMPALDNLAAAMYLNAWDGGTVITNQRKASDVLYTDCIDLFDFVSRVSGTNLPAGVTARAQYLVSLWDRVVVAEGHGSGHQESGGLSVYFPTKAVSNTYINKVDMGADSFWVDFLQMLMHPHRIRHTPLAYQEPEGGDIPVYVDFVGNAMNENSLEVRYRTGGTTGSWSDAHLFNDGGETYRAVIPAPSSGGPVEYYIAVEDDQGREYRHPPHADEGDPDTLFSFRVGTDTTPPAIDHEPPADQTSEVHGYPVSFNADDPYGLDLASASLHYRVNGKGDFVSLEPEHHLNTTEDGRVGEGDGDGAIDPASSPFDALTSEPRSTFSAVIPAQPFGSTVEYYFTVEDNSTLGNQGREPAGSGFHSFHVLKHPGAVAVLGTMGDVTAGFFAGLEGDGYLVEPLVGGLGVGDLDDFRTLVVVGPPAAVTSVQLDLIGGFVGDGGELMVLPDTSQWAGDDDGLLVALEQLTAGFDLAYSLHVTTGNVPAGNAAVNVSHPANEGVDLVTYLSAPVLTLTSPHNGSGASRLLWVPDSAVTFAMATYSGMGKVLCVTEGILDTSPGGEGTQSLNPGFALASFYWLHHNEKPGFAGIGDIAVEPGTTVVLNASSCYDPDGEIGSYLWTLPDRSVSDEMVLSRRYSSKGSFLHSLTITDGEEGAATMEFRVNVSLAPTARIHASETSVRTNEVVRFEASGQDEDGTIKSFLWDFGDGVSETGADVDHRWDTAGNGTYVVTLTAYDDYGVPGVATAGIEVRNRPPSAIIGPVMYLNGALEYRLGDRFSMYEDDVLVLPSNSTFDADGEGDMSVLWDYTAPEGWDITVDDNGTLSLNSSRQGTLTLGLNATDEYGDVGVDTLKVTVENRAPVAGFRIADNDGGKVRFDASATDDTYSDRQTLSYHWDFGDGQTGMGESPTHSYNEKGEYVVALTVTDDDGAASNVTMNITIDEMGPGLARNIAAGMIAAVAVIMIGVAVARMRKGKGGKEDEEESEGERKKTTDDKGGTKTVEAGKKVGGKMGTARPGKKAGAVKGGGAVAAGGVTAAGGGAAAGGAVAAKRGEAADTSKRPGATGRGARKGGGKREVAGRDGKPPLKGKAGTGKAGSPPKPGS